MFVLKISTFLVAYAAVVCQMHSSSAAPARPGSESLTDRFALVDYEARRLLSAIVKNVVQMTAEELEPSDDSSQGRLLSKRCSNLSTCVLGKLSQELHKLQTFPQTDVGAGTPGKKRNFLSRSGGMARSSFVPTDVGSQAFGRRRRSSRL